MEAQILGGTGAMVVVMTLAAPEAVLCPPGAVLALGAGLEVESLPLERAPSRRTSVGRMLVPGRGIDMAVHRCRAKASGARLILAPTLPADLRVVEVSGPVLVRRSCWVASGPGLDAASAVVPAALRRDGWLGWDGEGLLVVAGLGALLDLDGTQPTTLAGGRLVCWSGGAPRPVGADLALPAGGSGLWQSHDDQECLRLLAAFRPQAGAVP